MDNGKYDSTVSESKEESLFKAIQILQEEQARNKAKIVRPGISLGKTLFPHIAFLLLYTALIVGTLIFINSNRLESVYILIAIAAVLLIVLARAKRIITDAVLIYQQYAPESVRSACVFKPTCSEYMLLAVDKYGAVKGFAKGIKRLLRCHYPNGGEDYP